MSPLFPPSTSSCPHPRRSPTLSPRERVPGGRVRVFAFARESAPWKHHSPLAVLALAFLLLTTTAGPSIAGESDASPLPSASLASDGQDEQTPLAVPGASALALQ